MIHTKRIPPHFTERYTSSWQYLYTKSEAHTWFLHSLHEAENYTNSSANTESLHSISQDVPVQKGHIVKQVFQSKYIDFAQNPDCKTFS